MKNTIMIIRSILFMFLFYVWALLIVLLFLPTFLLPAKYAILAPETWTHGNRFLLKWITGIRIHVTGVENLPKKNGYIVASKHQSAMETVLLHLFVPNMIYILKKSLLFLPFAGWYFIKTGCIAIDRKAGIKSMHLLMTKASSQLKKGFNILIFPEGTRTKPRTKTKYNPGVFLLYENCKVPVVPVALNTGYFWPKNSFRRHAGTVTFKFLPQIPAGLGKKQFMNELEQTIESSCQKMEP